MTLSYDNCTESLTSNLENESFKTNSRDGTQTLYM